MKEVNIEGYLYMKVDIAGDENYMKQKYSISTTVDDDATENQISYLLKESLKISSEKKPPEMIEISPEEYHKNTRW